MTRDEFFRGIRGAWRGGDDGGGEGGHLEESERSSWLVWSQFVAGN